MKSFNNKEALSNAILAVIFLSGCASTQPKSTSTVGIVNGKYAIQTTISNNNKDKKVNLAAGQNYSCEQSFIDNDGKQQRITFDLKTSEDGDNIIWYNDKVNGITPEGYYIGKLVFKSGLGFVETTKGKQVLISSLNNSGIMAILFSVRDGQKFIKLFQRLNKGEITESEMDNAIKKQKIRGTNSTCTQTTNNTITYTKYMTDHEIDAYKHGQQIAVQQRAINSANYNANMARSQAQSAQMNYNMQQMLNRMNTYDFNIIGY